MQKATTAGGAGDGGKATVPSGVRLVASRFFFVWDEEHGEFRKRIHGENPRFAELKGIVDDPARVPKGISGAIEFHGRLLQACDVYDREFRPKGHSVVTVCGGFNGGGDDYKWCLYLEEIKGAVRRLTKEFGFSWLVSLRSHSDVWYAEIGFEDRRGVPEDGSDHSPCFGDDAMAFGRHRDRAVASGLPLGLVDWGHRQWSWGWDKVTGPYGWPRSAFDGALINPRNVANQYAAFDAAGDRFRDAIGVYESDNGTRSFYAVSGDDFVLRGLSAEGVHSLGRVKADLLEDKCAGDAGK